MVRKGLDFYDGLNVPAVSEIADGRFLMAGWTYIHGWGGNLVIRELVQLPGGRVGSKWMGEIMPATEEPELLAARADEAAKKMSLRMDGVTLENVQAASLCPQAAQGSQ